MRSAASLKVAVAVDSKKAVSSLSLFDAKLKGSKSLADDVAKAYDNVGASVGTTTTKVKNSTKEVDKATRGWSSFSKNVITANQTMALMSRTISLIKFPAMIAGAGYAAEALSAAAGGATALASALAPVAGLVTVAGQGMALMGQVQAVKMLSGIEAVTEAVGDMNAKLDESSEEFKQLSPQAQEFARTLDSFDRPLRRIQKSVQRPLFRGLSTGLDDARGALPAIEKILTGTARVMGRGAERIGAFAGSNAFSSDLQKIGQTNNKVLDRMAGVAVNLGKALMDVMVVARPLTKWVGKLVDRWSEGIMSASKLGRENGDLAKFFGKTKDVTQDLVRMVKGLGGALWEIGKAAQPLGEKIIDDLADGAQELRRWTESAKGKNELKEFFEQIEGPIYEAGRLLRDIAGVILSIQEQTGPALEPLLRSLRLELLPVFEDLVVTTTQAFGPVLVDALVSITKLFAKLAGTNGPLNLFIGTLGKMADALTWMIDNVPGFQAVIVTLLGMKAINAAFKFTAAITGVKSLIGWIGKLRVAWATALAGEAASTAGVAWATAFARVAGPVAVAALGAYLGYKWFTDWGKDWAHENIANVKTVDNPFELYTEGIADLGRSAAVTAGQMGALEGAGQKTERAFRLVDRAIPNGPKWETMASSIGHVGDEVAVVTNQLGRDSKAWGALQRAGKLSVGKLIDYTDRWRISLVEAGNKIANKFGDLGDAGVELARRLKRAMQDEQEAVDNASDKTDRAMQKIVGAFGDVRKAAFRMDEGVSSSTSSMVSSVISGIGQLGAKVGAALAAMGVSDASFSIGEGARKATDSKKPQRPQKGAIVHGIGTGDKVPLHIGGRLAAVVEPGELVSVTNRKATDALMSVNQKVPRFAEGGVVEALGPYDIPPFSYDANHAGGNSHMHIAMSTPAAVVAVGKKLQSMGMMVSEHPAFGGIQAQHAAGGYHYTNQAIDVNTASDETREEVSAVARLLSGKGGVLLSGPVATKIKRLMLSGPEGALKGIGQGGLDKVRNAANKFVASKAPAEGYESGASMTGSGEVEKMFAQVAKKKSQSKTATLALGMAGYAESGMQDLPGGDASSQGALQLLASTAAGLGVSPHDEKAIASLFFDRGFYGKGGANSLAASGLPAHLVAQYVQGSAFSDGSNYAAQTGPAQSWMQRYGLQKGGLVQALSSPEFAGWFGGGGSVTADRPTMIGIGDGRGRETATITRGDAPKRYAITITNWDEGTGYMREIAGDEIDDAKVHTRQLRRMS